VIAWDFGDNTVGTGQSVSHAYNAPGTYLVCVTERDSLQNLVCQNCVTVQVNGGNGAACQASFLATSFGLDAYFIDMSVAQLAPVIYNWDFGDGSTSTAQFPQHTYAVPGLYNVCLSINDGNCSDTFCSPVLIDTNVFNPGHGCNAFYAIIQLAPYQVTVVNLSSGLNLSYDWDFGDGSHDTNAYPSHVYAATGSYNLCLTVSDNNGCSSTYCDTLNVDTLGNIYRMAAPGFTLNVVSPAQLTGINEVDLSKSFSIYPNPFNTELHVIMKNGSVRPTDYRIFSIQGSVVSGGKLEGTNGTINTSSLSSGAYILEVKMNDGSSGYQRVIKN
jgi:PKD repeat protein